MSELYEISSNGELVKHKAVKSEGSNLGLQEIVSGMEKEFNSIKEFCEKNRTLSIVAIVALVYYLWLRKK